MSPPIAPTRSGHRLAVDIGGTFTDLVGVDGNSGHLVLAKVPTTPGRLEGGVIDAVGHSGLDPAAVGGFVHGTTAVINAITERKGARTALVTTSTSRCRRRFWKCSGGSATSAGRAYCSSATTSQWSPSSASGSR